MPLQILIVSLCLFLSFSIAVVSQPVEEEWPVSVDGFVEPEPGEHPRLLFRESELPRLREIAESADGQAIIKRLRKTLNGSDGRSMPVIFHPEVGPVDSDGASEFHQTAPIGAYTFSHIVGYGLLYQLTGDEHYAELGLECFDKAMQGVRDRDRRYSFKAPYGALRAGPVLGWTAIGFDLCYDGWSEADRERIGRAIAEYHESEKASLERLAEGSMPPFSNHYGMQVGGAALALLAVKDEPWVDDERIKRLLKVSQKSMIRNLTEGFGDGGYFAEGEGTGSMASHIVFITALQAWKNTAGLDFISPRPNAPMTALKWVHQTIARDGLMDYWPIRGGYPHNVWDRDDKSGSGYFSLGFGGVTDEQKQAMLWFYNRFLKAADDENQTPFDTPSPYPHFAVCALVNWPWGHEPVNPAEVLPNCFRDSKWGYYAFRNRWQDENDIAISVLTRDARGYIKSPTKGELHIAAFGKKETWGRLKGETVEWLPYPDGSAILSMKDGTSLVIDFSGASGAPCMLAMTGPGAGEGIEVELDGNVISFKFLTDKDVPKVEKKNNQIHIGGQRIYLENKRLRMTVID